MRRTLVLALLVLLAAPVGAATLDATDVWRPLFPYLGHWKGARTEAGKTVKLNRFYASRFDTREVEIRDSGGGEAGDPLRGLIRYDAARQVLVLHDAALDAAATEAATGAAEGAAADLTLAPPAAAGGPLVFSGGGERITYQRTGERSFVERVERAGADGALGLVTETRFTRAD